MKKTRQYRKRRRAEQERDTRRRITEALVELHGSIGPARTTVSDVASRAGVQRATVYRHFPDDAALFAACSAHWADANPLPDPANWREIDDPRDRLRVALEELYGFYARNEAMLDNTTRDEPRVDALRPSMDAFRGYLADLVDVLDRSRATDTDRATVRAALGHAVAFGTWRSLVREHALDPAAAVDLMVRLRDAAGTMPDGPSRSPR